MKNTLLPALILLFVHTSYAQWTWEDPLPQGHGITSVCIIDSTDVWAAGTASTLLHYKGAGTWERVEVCPDKFYIFQSIKAFQSDDIWLVGTNFDSSRVYHFDGIEWTLTAEMDGVLLAADWLSPTDAWAVGLSGLIVHFNGNNWLPVSGGATESLRDVHFTDPGHGWIVGDKGTILFYDGTAWSTQAAPVNGFIYRVWMTSNNEGWATAETNKLLHFDGTTWSVAPQIFADQPLEFFFLDPNTGWLVGDKGRIWKYKDGIWQAQVSNATQYLQGVFMQNENAGWVVGNYELVQRTGNVWLNHSLGANASDQHLSIDMIDADNGWVVGDAGMILKKANGNWQEVSSPTSKQLTDVFFLAPDDGWIVGEQGTILHYSGNNWQTVPSPTVKRIWEVHMIAPNNGWAVGETGLILHFNGNQWLQVAGPTAQSLYHLYFYDADHGWAVGTGGIILRCLNGVWSVFDQIPVNNLYYVLQTTETDGWMVGDQNTALRFDGTQWNTVPLTQTVPPLIFTSLACPQPDHCFAGVLTRGYILEWKNDQWTKKTQPGFFSNRRIDFVNDTTGFYIGYGSIIRLNTAAESVGTEQPSGNHEEKILPPLIFPNPASGSVFARIVIPEATLLEVRLVPVSGIQGRLLMRERVAAGELLREFSVEDCPPGVYFLEFQGKDWQTRQKLVLR